MDLQLNRVLIDPKTGNQVMFCPIDIERIITRPENPNWEGLIDLNYCCYSYLAKKDLHNFLIGDLLLKLYTGSGRFFDPNSFGLDYFFKHTRALTHKDEYFKNSINLTTTDICVVWALGISKMESLVLENWDLVRRINAGMKFTARGTNVWGRETLMNKQFVRVGNKWNELCKLYSINI